MRQLNVCYFFRSMKLQCELYPSRHVALCLDPYCGLGFALWCLSSVYSGHHTLLIPPSEVESNPAVWLTAVSQYKVRDTFCSYGEFDALNITLVILALITISEWPIELLRQCDKLNN